MIKTHKSITLPAPVRLSFPTVWEPKQIELRGRPTGDPKFSSGLVIERDSPNVAFMEKVQKELVAAKYESPFPITSPA